MSSKDDSIPKNESEWRARLDPDQYRILREKGTERAFTGKYWDTKTKGRYHCAGCGAELFDSAHKYDSGSGWPSFTAPMEGGSVATEVDRSHGMVRTEIHCASCSSHLGHVFPDGPGPEGLRFCVNSASLDLVPEADDE